MYSKRNYWFSSARSQKTISDVVVDKVEEKIEAKINEDLNVSTENNDGILDEGSKQEEQVDVEAEGLVSADPIVKQEPEQKRKTSKKFDIAYAIMNLIYTVGAVVAIGLAFII